MLFEIYIDNERYYPKKKKFKTLGLAIRDVNIFLERENKVTIAIYLNGIEFNERTYPFPDKNILEFKTKSEISIILEGVYHIEKNRNRYEDLLHETSEITLDEAEEGFVLNELVNIVSWTYKQLLIIKNNTLLDMSHEDFDILVDEYQDAYMNLKKSFDLGDMEIAWELFQEDFPELLYRVSQKVEIFSDEVIKAQNQLKFLS